MRDNPALTILAAVTARARQVPIPASCETELRRGDRPARAGWAALRLLVDVDIFILAGLLFADSGWGDDGARASAPMLMSAWPGRAAAMVPAPVGRSQLWGHRQQIGNCAALT